VIFLAELAAAEANRQVLTYLAESTPGAAPERTVEGADTWKLGTHPDLVNYFWYQLGGVLPVDCKRIAYDAPLLAEPTTSIIFALGGGTGTLALRLPGGGHDAGGGLTKTLRYPNVTLEASELGEAWFFVEEVFQPDVGSRVRVAYEAALNTR
jgi:hypothetical protein